MTHSVRTRFVGWFKRFIDYVGKKPLQVLRSGEVHSQAGGDRGYAGIVGIDNSRCEGQIHNPVIVPAFRDYINELNGRPVVANFPPFRAHGELPPTRNHDLGNTVSSGFIFHAHEFNPSSFGKSYLNADGCGESIAQNIVKRIRGEA